MNLQKDPEIIKTDIEKTVLSYKRLFPEEYVACKELVKQKREGIKGNFGQMGTDFFERPITEYPETLHSMFDVDALAFLETKKGIRWFAKSYPEFRSTPTV